MRKNITENDIKNFCDLYNRGMSSYEIAKETGFGATSIRRKLKSAGIIMRPDGASRIPEDVKKQFEILYQKGCSSEKIAKKFEVDGSSVIRHLKKVGISIRKSSRNKKQLKIFTKILNDKSL